MKACEAWIKAKEGQQIYRVSRPGQLCLKKPEDNYVRVSRVFGVDLSTDDWEIVKKKHSLTFTNVEVIGTVDDNTISSIIKEGGLVRPEKFTKVHLEWEDE